MNPEPRNLILLLGLGLLLAVPVLAGAGDGSALAASDDSSARVQAPGSDSAADWDRVPFMIPVVVEQEKKRETLVFKEREPQATLVLQGIIESDGVLTALVNDRMVRPGDMVHEDKILAIRRYEIVVEGPDGKREISILAGDDSARVSSRRLTD